MQQKSLFSDAMRLECARLRQAAARRIAIAVVAADADHAARLIDAAADALVRARRAGG